MKINKTRLINLNYNDGKRTIYNECFDYKKGSNTLFSMDNGLGKTVIIQFMLQPFLRRNRDLAKRDFTSYFKTSNPVYVMHELLLDNNDKLLIGVLLKGDKNSEDKNKVKVIGFTHKYKIENEFDIEHIPFVQRYITGNKIVTFTEAENLLKTEAKTNPNLFVYNFDDSIQKKKYFDYLNINGINNKEWESLIKKINQEESGLSELFSNCETTPELLKKQIIPIIDEKLKVTEDRIQSLISHTKKYIQTYMQHQNEIEKSIAYKEFLNDIENMDNEFDLCKENSQEINQINLFLKILFLSITNKLDNKDNDEDNFIKIIAHKEKEIKDTKYKQISYNSYIQKGLIDDIKDEIAEKMVEIESINTDISQYSKNKGIQECAKYYARLVQKKSSLLALKETLKNNEANESDTIRKINSYKKRLKELYQIEINQLDEKFKNIEDEVLAKNQLKDKTNSILANLKQTNIDLNEKLVKNNIIINSYEEKESLLSIQSNEFKEVLTESMHFSKKELIDKFIEKIIDKEQNLLKEKNNISNELIVIKNNIETKLSELDISKEKQNQIKNDIYKTELKLNDIQLLKTELLEIIRKYDCDEITNKNISKIKKYIVNELDKYSELQKEYLKSLNHYEQLLSNLENKQIIPINENFIEILHEYNIPYMFGLDWLKSNNSKNINEKIGILRDNPLIPYSLIISDEDKDKLLNIDLSNLDVSLLPIFTPSTIYSVKTNLLSNNYYTINNIQYLSSINFNLLDDEKYETYINEIKDIIKDLNEKLIISKNDIQILTNDMSKLESISFDDIYEKNLNLNLDSLNKDLSQTSIAIKNINDEILNLKNDLEVKNEIIRTNEREINRLYALRNNNNDLLSLSEDYDAANKEHDVLEQNYEHNKKEIASLSNSLVKADEFISTKKIEAISISNELKNIKTKFSKIIINDNNSFEEIDDNISINEIEKLIETLENKLNKDVLSIQQDIKQIEEDISYINDDISRSEKKYNLVEDDYKNISYNEDLYDNYDELIYSKEADKEDIEDSISELEREKAVIESKYEDILDEIHELGYNEPIAEHLIENIDFDETIDKLENELELLQKNNAESLQLYEKFSNCLLKIKKYIKSFTLADNENLNLIDDISELKIAIDKLDDNLLTLSEYKDAFNKQENKIRQKLNNISRNYIEIDEQMSLILQDDDILSVKQKLDIFKESLIDLLKYLDLTTKNIHDEEMFIINEAIEYACSVYSEIIQIDKQSKIVVNGKNKQMLQIKVPTEDKLNKENIEYFVRNIINEIIDSYNSVDIDKILSNQLKSINLFEKLINGLNSVKIYIYKIEKHSLIRKEWKEINSENSGGEQFVSVFILFVSLLSYMRDDDENINSGKVLIMDNPFAKTNAEHLLVPMFDIAKKFNVQLICFSGIGGSSVYNRFDVIYASKIIKDKYRDNEILEFTKNEENCETVEMLGISISEDKAEQVNNNSNII